MPDKNYNGQPSQPVLMPAVLGELVLVSESQLASMELSVVARVQAIKRAWLTAQVHSLLMDYALGH
ncbi:hypothetical protein [Pseudomonas oryzicola]|uniref:Uncharacterized protein n=1 Tax=Pseudomonas oryzicola TaxID=485876 RepID=A0ABS6QGL5_9PSED|nr:hypothetical protein [Pseudomonas oryzicola]MBV4493339.1 hypothetical protein [Pseudomonas oryzicola]